MLRLSHIDGKDERKLYILYLGTWLNEASGASA